MGFKTMQLIKTDVACKSQTNHKQLYSVKIVNYCNPLDRQYETPDVTR